MKKIFLGLLFLCTLMLTGQNTFQKVFNLTSGVTLSSIGILPNGNIIVLSDSVLSDYIFTELTPNGQVVQSFTINMPLSNYSYPVLSISPSGNLDVITFGTFQTTSGYAISRFTVGGTPVFHRLISAPDFFPYLGPHINYFANGDLALSLSNNNSVGLIRMDGNGNILWFRKLTADTLEPKDPSFVPCMTADGGIMVPGKRGGDNFFIKLDGSGNIQWSKLYSTQGLFYTRPVSLIEAQGGGYYVGGLMVDSAASLSSGYLMKLDINGNILWLKNYLDSSGYDPQINEIFQLYSGELVMVVPDYFVTYLYVADPNGNLIKSKIIDIGGAIGNIDLMVTNSTDILLGINGYNISGNEMNVVMRSDWLSFLWCDFRDVPVLTTTENYNPTISSGMIDLGNSVSLSTFTSTISTRTCTVSDLCAGTGINETQPFSFSLSPNPASTFLNMDLGDSFRDGMSYRIIDILGKVFSSGPINQSTSQLNIRFLSPGLYILDINSPDGILSSKFIKD